MDQANLYREISHQARIKIKLCCQTRKVSMLGHILMKDDRSLKVGARSLWTMAERKMRVKGIPMMAYTMQAVFPVLVRGWIWP